MYNSVVEVLKIKKNIARIMIIFIIVIVFSLKTNAESIDTDLQGKRILFISSYSPSFNTFFNQVEGLSSVFDETEAVFDIEFMDTKRFYTEENIHNFLISLQYKIEHSEKYDLIIAGDDNALDFLMTNEDLFPDQPIVFLGINDVNKAKSIAEDARITGIYESVSLEGTIKLARALMPDAKKVFALVDNTVTGQTIKEMYLELGAFENEFVLETIDLKEMTFNEYEEELKKIPSKDIVLLIAAHRDITGETLTYQEGVDITLRNLEQPVFGLYDFIMDSGLLGGEVVSFYEQGRLAGEIGKKILNGDKIEDMEIVANQNIKMLDYEIFSKYNLEDNKLPKDIVYVNREENYFLKILPYLILILVVISVEGMLILYLRNNIKNRKIAEHELIRKKEDLLVSNEELLTLNEEMAASNEDLSESNEKLSNALQKIEEQQKEIIDLIFIDSLTKLKNRRAINELVHQWLEETKGDMVFSILFLDVDNFKLINDSFGHDFGDKVIIGTSSRLESLETDAIKIGRFGGDEFLIIYRDRNLNRLPEFLNELESLFKKPFVIDNHTIFLTVSIGAAIYPIHGVGEEELIKKADMALYKAKESGKNRAVIYNQKMIEELEDKVIFQSCLRSDFENGEFYMHYQPLYEAKTDRFVGAEALIRWKNSEFGQVSPIKLIKVAEEMGIIIKIGKWVLREACNFAKKINQQSDVDLIISINISSVQMMHPDFIKDFSVIMQDVGVNPKYICLEITETMLFQIPDDNINIIDKLKAMGVCIALDDFGTGYSSLSYFKNIPATTLKIDKEFIDNLAINQFDQYMVETIIHLAHHNDLIVVAEGVENLEQLEILLELNCDLIQGYYFSKPVSEIEVMKLLLKE